jgi:uncharacterized protein (DUF1778 family)
MATTQHDARLNFRLSRAVKERVERAALLSGQSVSDFAVSALARSADDILQRHNILTLADQDRDFFLALLDQDDKPSEKALAAAARYQMGERRGNEYHG